MVSVERTRCAYCGACVSLCPEDALDLCETQLVVTDDCVDCILCLAACPMGALAAADAAARSVPAVKDQHDVVVVGAGPAVSRAGLSRYETEWAEGIERRMARNYRLRARFPPRRRVGERFMRLFAVSVGAGM